MDLFKTFGHFHVVLLHLPIGLIAGVGVLEALSLRGGGGESRAGIRVLLWLLAMSAIAAASTGYVLSFQGYIGSTLQLHMWLGIGVAAFSLCTLVMHEWVLRRARFGGPARRGLMVYRLGLLCTIGLIVPAGHLGGTLTHGDDFLFGPGPPVREEAVAAPVQATVFRVQVVPVLEANCFACHSERKQKGGLALHTHEALLAGGKHGPVIVAGDVRASELVRRMRLPLEDHDHMPPKDKRQPEEAEIRAIEAWIAGGASFTAPVSSSVQRGGEAAVRASEVTSSEREGARAVLPASETAVAALRAALVHVQVVEPGSPLLWVDFGAPAGAGLVTDDRVMELLGPVEGNVQELSLARSGVTDRSARLIAGMERLRKLDLSRTGVTDAGVAVFGPLNSVEELNLVGTDVGDGSVGALSAMQSLKRVFLWGTKITDQGVERLKKAHPDLVVERGTSLAGRVLEEESAPRLVKAAGRAASEAAGSGVAPQNTTCPVTGKEIDARYVILYEGRRIGLCCPNCAKKFWDDPAAYLKGVGR